MLLQSLRRWIFIIFVKKIFPHASGAVLCFLPGWQDIKAVQEKLEQKRHFSSGSQIIFPCKYETSLQRATFVLQV